MNSSIVSLMKKMNLENVRYKDLELVKKIVSFDYGQVILFRGKYINQDCIILEVQNIEQHILSSFLEEYLNFNDKTSIKKKGISYDNIKGTLFILYEFDITEHRLLKDSVEEMCKTERLQVFINIVELVKTLHQTYLTPVYLIFSWNFILNKKQEVLFIEPYLSFLLDKIYAKEGYERRRREIRTVSPEYFKNILGDGRSDVWILGNLLFELMVSSGKNLYNVFKINENEIKRKLNDLKFKFNFKDLTKDQNLMTILDLSLRIDYKQRLSLNDMSLLCTKMLRESIKSNQCQTCNKLVIAKVHCVDCSVNVCSICLSNHSEHNIINIKVIFNQCQEYKHNINSKVKEISSKIAGLNLESKHMSLEKQKTSLNSIRIDQEKIIKKNCEMLKDLINELEKDQIDLLKNLQNKFLRKMNDLQSESTKRCTEIKNKVVQCGKDSEKENGSNVVNAFQNISSLKKIYSECEKLGLECVELEEYVKSNMIVWDQQFNSKLQFSKNICDNLTSNILENITFVKFNSLLKCGKNEEYIINEELILKYLEDNFFFLKKFLPNLSNVLTELSNDIDNTSLEKLRDLISNDMSKARKEIVSKIYNEFENQFDKLIDFNMNELHTLISREKINITTASSATLNLILNIEKEIETRIIDNFKRYIITNKKKILSKLSSILAQDLLIQLFSEQFQLFFSGHTNELTKNIKLDLSDHNIGREGFKILSELMKNCPGLNTINLKSNDIGDEGCFDLCQVLKKTQSLQNLSLNLNSIRLEGIKLLVVPLYSLKSLRKLTLFGNEIGSEGMNILSEALRGCSNLQSLDLGKTNIQDEGIKNLCHYLKNNKNIENLSLYNNSISDTGIEEFSEILNETSLINISLLQNLITFKGSKLLCDTLKKNNVLLSIDLGNNTIGDLGAKYVGEMLSVNKTIQEISLIGNSINDEGGKALTEGLNNNKAINKIKLENNKFSDKNNLFYNYKNVISLDDSNIPEIEEKDSIVLRPGNDIQYTSEQAGNANQLDRTPSLYNDNSHHSSSINANIKKTFPKYDDRLINNLESSINEDRLETMNLKNNVAYEDDMEAYFEDKINESYVKSKSLYEDQSYRTKSLYEDNLDRMDISERTKSLYEDKLDRTERTKSIYQDKLDRTKSLYEDNLNKTMKSKSLYDDKINVSESVIENRVDKTKSLYEDAERMNKSMSVYENNFKVGEESKSIYNDKLNISNSIEQVNEMTKSLYEDRNDKTNKSKSSYDKKVDKSNISKSLYENKLDISDKSEYDDKLEFSQSISEEKANKTKSLYEDNAQANISKSLYEEDKQGNPDNLIENNKEEMDISQSLLQNQPLDINSDVEQNNQSISLYENENNMNKSKSLYQDNLNNSQKSLYENNPGEENNREEDSLNMSQSLIEKRFDDSRSLLEDKVDDNEEKIQEKSFVSAKSIDQSLENKDDHENDSEEEKFVEQNRTSRSVSVYNKIVDND